MDFVIHLDHGRVAGRFYDPVHRQRDSGFRVGCQLESVAGGYPADLHSYGQYTYEGLFGGDTTTFKVGARNLTDEDPPLAQGGYLGNIHQPVGRYVYAGVRHAF